MAGKVHLGRHSVYLLIFFPQSSAPFNFLLLFPCLSFSTILYLNFTGDMLISIQTIFAFKEQIFKHLNQKKKS